MLAQGSRDWPMTERNGREEKLSGGIAAENGSRAVMQRPPPAGPGGSNSPAADCGAGAQFRIGVTLSS